MILFSCYNQIMNLTVTPHKLSGTTSVPGSKSHTIRALLLASLAEGTSYIRNPLPSADCLAAAKAIKAFGASVEFTSPSLWTVQGAGKNAHLPSFTIDVENSGSTLYFFTPVAATFAGTSRFTGDASIQKRPVNHLLDALRQLGAQAETDEPGRNSPPFSVTGPIRSGSIVTDGRLSQYISGFMMASALMDGTIDMTLTDPKETPYLTMTRMWLESVGIPVEMSEDFRHIKVSGPHEIAGFDKTVPADWEAVAFPLMAALVSGSDITISGVDMSGSQGDDAVVDVLKSCGADLDLVSDGNGSTGSLVVRGSNSTHLAAPDGLLKVNVSGFPDAVCALSAIATLIEGTVVLTDTGVCRKKETDRIKVMSEELCKLGAQVVDGLTLDPSDSLYGDCIIIKGGKKLHGGTVESYADHRVAMSLACLGLGLPAGETLTVKGAECCSVSFPGFVGTMNAIGAAYIEN